MRSLHIAATGMLAQELNIDSISQNIANLNTSGYKKCRPEFQELMYETKRAAATPVSDDVTTPTSSQMGTGTRNSSILRMFFQGDLQQTENPLDLAIKGEGFFQVSMPDGQTAYTRDGSFRTDATGRLVTADGYALFPDIVVPNNASSVTIGDDGTVVASIQGNPSPVNLGQIQLVNFVNPAGMESIGHNLLLATEASGEAYTGIAGTDGMGSIQQGYVEMSNVHIVEEMINMIMAQRAYEMNAKVIKTSDNILGELVNLKS